MYVVIVPNASNPYDVTFSSAKKKFNVIHFGAEEKVIQGYN